MNATQVLTIIEACQQLARYAKKYCMYININNSDMPSTEVKSAPYLNFENHSQVICDGSAFLMFDSEEEMEKYYGMTVGDDGPTKSNSYNGPSRTYALTIGPDGQLLSENT